MQPIVKIILTRLICDKIGNFVSSKISLWLDFPLYSYAFLSLFLAS